MILFRFALIFERCVEVSTAYHIKRGVFFFLFCSLTDCSVSISLLFSIARVFIFFIFLRYSFQTWVWGKRVCSYRVCALCSCALVSCHYNFSMVICCALHVREKINVDFTVFIYLKCAFFSRRTPLTRSATTGEQDEEVGV